MITINDLPADIIFVIALLLYPTDLYNLALVTSKYAQIIKNRKVINYHLDEKNEIVDSLKIKYFVLKHTGNKHGLYESWYKTGQKYKQMYYQNDKLCGLYESWYENGQKRVQIQFQNGKLHGLYETWYENGQKMANMNMQNKKLHGLYETWYETGQKYEQINFQNDKINNLCEHWHTNGHKCELTNCQNMIDPHHLYAYYCKYGQLCLQINYPNE